MRLWEIFGEISRKQHLSTFKVCKYYSAGVMPKNQLQIQGVRMRIFYRFYANSEPLLSYKEYEPSLQKPAYMRSSSLNCNKVAFYVNFTKKHVINASLLYNSFSIWSIVD